MTKPFTLTLVATLLATAAHAQVPSDLGKRVDSYVKQYTDLRTFSGNVLIAKGEKVLYHKAFGDAVVEFDVPNRLDTRYRIASITKTFTLIILNNYIDDGLLKEDDKLSKFVPSFPNADNITVAQLAGHRSGIADLAGLRRLLPQNLSLDEAIALLAKEPFAAKPGERYLYTTANYMLLAKVIETVSGRTFAEEVGRQVYEPAGMKDSGESIGSTVVPKMAQGYMADPFGDGLAICPPEDTSWKIGGGTSYATARDLHRFFVAYYAGKLTRKLPEDKNRTGAIEDRPVSQFIGSFPGANASIAHLIDDGISVVVLNNTYANTTATIVRDLARIALGKPTTGDFRSPVLPSAREPRAAGQYAWQGITTPFEVVHRSGRLVAIFNRVRMGELLPLGNGDYFMPSEWSFFRFRFGPDGKFQQGATWSPGQTPEQGRAITRVE